MTETVTVEVVRMPHARGHDLPRYETAHAAGMDVRAACREAAEIPPGARALIPTGLQVAVPPGWELQVRPRSGLAARSGITCLNTPGTIDADFRGEIKIILINHGTEAVTVEPGMRVAQLVLSPAPQVLWRECETLAETERGTDGFGSTGAH